MPHLQFEFNFKLTTNEKRDFSQKIMEHFSDIMDTATGHIGITLREFDSENLIMGRAENIGSKTAYVNADIRKGRSYEQRRNLAMAFMEEIRNFFSVPKNNIYVIITEHEGEDFHLYERSLKSWSEGEDPLA